MTSRRDFSRRQFLFGLGVAPLVPAFLPAFHQLIAAERKRAKIRDVQVMIMQGPGRSYTLVKITSDNGLYGIAEAYGTPGVGTPHHLAAAWLNTAARIDIMNNRINNGAGNTDALPAP